MIQLRFPTHIFAATLWGHILCKRLKDGVTVYELSIYQIKVNLGCKALRPCLMNNKLIWSFNLSAILKILNFAKLIAS